jgi:hypothetical protein
MHVRTAHRSGDRAHNGCVCFFYRRGLRASATPQRNRRPTACSTEGVRATHSGGPRENRSSDRPFDVQSGEVDSVGVGERQGQRVSPAPHPIKIRALRIEIRFSP